MIVISTFKGQPCISTCTLSIMHLIEEDFQMEKKQDGLQRVSFREPDLPWQKGAFNTAMH